MHHKTGNSRNQLEGHLQCCGSDFFTSFISIPLSALTNGKIFTPQCPEIFTHCVTRKVKICTFIWVSCFLHLQSGLVPFAYCKGIFYLEMNASSNLLQSRHDFGAVLLPSGKEETPNKMTQNIWSYKNTRLVTSSKDWNSDLFHFGKLTSANTLSHSWINQASLVLRIRMPPIACTEWEMYCIPPYTPTHTAHDEVHINKRAWTGLFQH